MAGYTDSSNFPTTAGAYDTTHNGGRDGFVARLEPPAFSYTATIDPISFDGTVSLDYGDPFASYVIFHSADPLNGTLPGMGLVGGLHISLLGIWSQLDAAIAGNPLFGGTLDANGAFSYTVPGMGALPFLSGQTWWSVGIQQLPTGVYEPANLSLIHI